ncbi:MAG: DUF4366 domain-containing protein [Lachnospiraceae bacterium]|nr:DUF4366 domain-containing protein [Lachnospiraceae bacterium]
MKKSNKGFIPKAMMAVGTITAAFFITGAPLIVKAAPEEEAEEVVCTCSEKCDEDHINEECEVCKYDHTYCQATEPVRTVEYVDEDGNPIEPPVYGPLTPDGNMDIVDDYGSIEAGGKQFITVVTKSGHYFYIIIDRDDKGNETVHFLNKVDEADLLALMDDDEVKAYEEEVKAKEEAETVEEVKPEEEKDQTGVFSFPNLKKDKEVKTEKKLDKNKLLPVAAVVIVLIGVGGFMLLKKKKNNKPKKVEKDPDEDYNEEDYLDSLPDEEEDDFDIPDEIPNPDEEDNA